MGHAYLPDKNAATELTSTSLWHLAESHRYRAFREVTEAVPLGMGVGFLGRVLASRRPQWIYDVNLDENFRRTHTGRDIKVKGAFSMPVLAGTNVVAVLEFFSDDPEPIDRDLLELMGYVGTQLGRVAERERAEEALRMQVAETKLLVESAYDAFVAVDPEGRIADWNRAAEEMFGWRRNEVIGQPLAENDRSPPLPRQPPSRHRALHGDGRGEGAEQAVRTLCASPRRDGVPGRSRHLAVWNDDETRFCAFLHDITERKDAELELRAADERSRASEQRLLATQRLAGVGSWTGTSRTTSSPGRSSSIGTSES